MKQETRSSRGIKNLMEQHKIFQDNTLIRLQELEKDIKEKYDKLNKISKRIARGHEQLIEWVGMTFNCYIPKDLCLLNLSLMGMPITEKMFLEQEKKAKYGQVIRNDNENGEKLYNFKLVFKTFFFSNLANPIRELSTSRPMNCNLESFRKERQAKIMMKAIRKHNPTNNFFFDSQSLLKFQQEIYGENIKDIANNNNIEIKPNNERKNKRR